MLVIILSVFLVSLLSMCSGIYIRDGQNDHKSITPLGKGFHYTLAGIMFTLSVVLGTILCTTLN